MDLDHCLPLEGHFWIYVYAYTYVYIYIYTYIYIAYLCVYMDRDSMDELLQNFISQDKWILFHRRLKEPNLLFVQGLPSLPMGAIQFNQFDIHVQSFRFTHFLQLWLTLPLSYSPFWELMCFATEVAHSCRIIFCPMALSSPSVSVVLLLSHTLLLLGRKKMEKEWS